MNKLIRVMIVGLAVAPLAAQAEIEYDYVDALYVNTDVDDLDESADGFGLRGSFGLGRNLHLVGSWFSRELDIGNQDLDFDKTSVGIGVNFAIGTQADWIADIEYLNAEVGNFGDQDGYQFTTGFRALASERFELDAGIRYEDLDEGETFGYVRGIYGFNETWGLVGEFEIGEDSDSFLVGARASF